MILLYRISIHIGTWEYHEVVMKGYIETVEKQENTFCSSVLPTLHL